MREKVGQLKSDKTHVEKQCELEAHGGCCTRILLDSTIEENGNLSESVWDVRAQYGLELADVWYEHDGLQAWLPFLIVAVKPLTSLKALIVRDLRRIKMVLYL